MKKYSYEAKSFTSEKMKLPSHRKEMKLKMAKSHEKAKNENKKTVDCRRNHSEKVSLKTGKFIYTLIYMVVSSEISVDLTISRPNLLNNTRTLDYDAFC